MKIAAYFLWLCSLLAASVCVAEFRAGSASVRITPPPETPMAGYYFERSAVGVHDDLQAKTIVMDDGSTRVALVALDLISTTREVVQEARQLIWEACGIPLTNIMISATHAHTGPILAQPSVRSDAQGGKNPLAMEYTRRLPQLILQSVQGALSNLSSTTVSSASGTESHLPFVRRFHMADGTVGWNPGKLNPKILRPAGAIDPELPVVAFAKTSTNRAVNPKLFAVYVNFAIHLDTVGGREISADFPYYLGERLSESLGTNLLTLFTIGCAGNINHIDVSWAGAQSGQNEASRIGTILAAEVLKTLKFTAPVTNTILRSRSQLVELDLPSITDAEIKWAEESIRLANPV